MRGVDRHNTRVVEEIPMARIATAALIAALSSASAHAAIIGVTGQTTHIGAPPSAVFSNVTGGVA